jgi:hypothetical protein
VPIKYATSPRSMRFFVFFSINVRPLRGQTKFNPNGYSPAKCKRFVFYEKIKIMSIINYLTQEGFNKLKADLDEMKSTGRDEASRAIAEAREKGDLSENAEYDAAKEAQGMLELRINELEMVLSNARILDQSQLDASKVTVMANVTIKI